MKRKYLGPLLLMAFWVLLLVLGFIFNETDLIAIGFAMILATFGVFFDNTVLSDEELKNLGW